MSWAFPLLALILAPPPSAHPAAGGPWQGMVASAWGPGAGNRCVPDVNRAIMSLDSRGTAFRFAYTAEPALHRLGGHWQGIARLPREDGTWLAVSRSGSPRAVIIVGPSGVTAEISAPEGLTHAGGIQMLGNVLAVPYEHKSGSSRVVLYDVSDPASPRVLYSLDRSGVPAPSEQGHASAAALGRLADGRLLLIIGVKSSKILDLYVSNQADLSRPGLEFHRVATIDHAVEGRFQSHNLVTQCDGTLFLVGGYYSGIPLTSSGADMLGWYRLDSGPDGAPVLVAAGKREMSCQRCNFGAATGVFVDPAGQLLLYGTEHTDSGPDRSVQVEEFRARTAIHPAPSGG